MTTEAGTMGSLAALGLQLAQSIPTKQERQQAKIAAGHGDPAVDALRRRLAAQNLQTASSLAASQTGVNPALAQRNAQQALAQAQVGTNTELSRANLQSTLQARGSDPKGRRRDAGLAAAGQFLNLLGTQLSAQEAAAEPEVGESAAALTAPQATVQPQGLAPQPIPATPAPSAPAPSQGLAPQPIPATPAPSAPAGNIPMRPGPAPAQTLQTQAGVQPPLPRSATPLLPTDSPERPVTVPQQAQPFLDQGQAPAGNVPARATPVVTGAVIDPAPDLRLPPEVAGNPAFGNAIAQLEHFERTGNTAAADILRRTLVELQSISTGI